MTIVRFLAFYFPDFLRRQTFAIVDACSKKNDQSPQVLIDYWRTNATGMSLRSINHFLQLRNTTTKHEHKKYDFGKKENLKRYGSESPPIYDFRLLKNRVTIVAGDKDNFITHKGMLALKEELCNARGV